VRRGGKSLAEIARAELGNQAATIVSLAILFIVIIALAGLGIVVVKALGGEETPLTKGLMLNCPQAPRWRNPWPTGPLHGFPPGKTDLFWARNVCRAF